MAEHIPTHPGAILREDVLPATKKTQAQLAAALGVTRLTVNNLLNERQAVTPEMALRLGKVFGNGGDFWLRLQANHDLGKARAKMAEQLDAIPTWDAA